ncbi:MAG: hypothetical protein SOV71_05005 [Anaerovoracaceae bacterium]|nr:hypothetical protein [Bacillota bacterium]MDY2670896.1 hypothetical protein [Anaerovoracaceae bacterium]
MENINNIIDDMIVKERRVLRRGMKNSQHRPSGRLRADLSKNNIYRSIKNGDKWKAISYNDNRAAAQRKYMMARAMCQSASENIDALSRCREILKDFTPTNADDLNRSLSAAYRLESDDPIFKELGFDVPGIWMNEDYPHNELYEEDKVHTTASGVKVRSRAEVIIANELTTLRKNFLYEKELVINGIPYYPDFTILLPETNEIRYIEHFGMMDNPKYANHFLVKNSAYISAGIMPYHDILYTFDGKGHSLNAQEIHELLCWFFGIPV